MTDAAEKTLVCIVCPTGCRLYVDETLDGLAVRGAGCERGRQYATSEFSSPVRIFTGTVRVRGGRARVVPVRSDVPVERDVLMDVARLTAKIVAEAPVDAGAVLAELPGLAKLVATGAVERG